MIKETLIYSDFLVRKKVRSRINPNLAVMRDAAFRCPRCSETNWPLDHGETRSCVCGLSMTRYGNALECEIEPDHEDS